MVLLAAEGPSVAVSGWPAILILIGSLSTAAVAIVAFFRKVAFPLAELVAEIRRDFPVWTDIADRFGKGGQETISVELRALASNDEVSAANQKAMLAKLETVIARNEASDLKLAQIDQKLTDTRHDIIGDISTLRTGVAGAKTLVEAIVDASETLLEVKDQLHALQQPPEEP